MFKSWKEFIVWENTTRDTIDVKKSYIDIADDFMAGVLLSQIVYWYLPNKDGKSKLRVKKEGHYWLAKTIEEWYEEIRFSKRNYQTAIKKLENENLIVKKIFKFNGSPTTHIRLNIPAFLTKLNELFKQQQTVLKEDEFDDFNIYLINEIAPVPLSYMEMPGSGKWKCPDRANGNARIGQMEMPGSGKTLTEITTEITTEINNQSIYQKKVEKLEVAAPIKKVLLQKIDRLIDHNIRLEDIVVIFQSYKERSNNSDTFDMYFVDVLERVLNKTKGKIHNIKDLIHATIYNDSQPKDKPYPMNKQLSDSEKRKDMLLGKRNSRHSVEFQDIDVDENMTEEEVAALREETKKAIQELYKNE